MSDPALIDLAIAAGLQPQWQDAAGAQKTVTPESLRSILSAMGLSAATRAQLRESRADLAARNRRLPPMIVVDVGGEVEVAVPAGGQVGRLTLETGGVQDIALLASAHGATFTAPSAPGYHRLEIGDREMTLAVAPLRGCLLSDRVTGRRAWGAAVQVYSLRGSGSQSHDGFGGFADLAAFAGALGARGAQALAISPVHALFAADPSRYSPYAPSSRLFLNSLYADPGLIAGEEPAASCPSQMHDVIDWATAAPAKLQRLREAYDRLSRHGGAVWEEFETFRRAGGRDLERHATYEALHADFFARTGTRGWPQWPHPYHDPESPAVAAFKQSHADEVTFHAVLQWLADAGLARAQAAARNAGMGVGLIADLAVGLDAGGSQAWSRPDDLIAGVSVGAPPDIFQPRGQDWGVAALSPDSLRRDGYDAFLATLRRALRHSGGVRIDHAMGLRRLWLTVHGASPAEGAYLSYPFADLLRLIALESWRAQAIVIGEDLGTVPEGFRDALHAKGVLGMSVLWFERAADGKTFAAPGTWSADSAAMTTTHDLPTVAGWWTERDIDWQGRLGQAGDDEIAKARAARQIDRDRLWTACVDAGVAAGAAPSRQTPGAAVDAAIAFISAAPCPLAVVPVEDLVGLEDQPNRPGTIDEHPNWRRRLPSGSQDLLDAPMVAARVSALSHARPAQARPPEAGPS